MEYLILVVGFFLLIKGADFFVDGASAVSAIAKVPPLLIGLTIVAFGTSAPEAAVSFVAALKGSNDIVIGNVVWIKYFQLTDCNWCFCNYKNRYRPEEYDN